MILAWWRRRRRRKILSQPFPAVWDQLVETNFALYRRLPADARQKLRRAVQIFVAEKYWEGCNGLAMTDEIKVTIAAQACMLVLGFKDELFERLQTVLVYPGKYFVENRQHGPGGLVVESTDLRLGEAWHSGPVILSWPDVLHGGRVPDDGHNVVFHEFAHVLDMHDHIADGTPALQSIEQYETWKDVMAAEYNSLVKHSQRRRVTLLDHYGAESESEFFAVATECFFEKPLEMADTHPRLYELLREFYRQDPAASMSLPNGPK